MDARDGERFLQEEIAELARPVSWADATERLRGFCRRNGFDHAVHTVMSSDRRHGGGGVFVTTYPVTWIERYLEQNYQAVDPVLTEARRAVVPFDWSGLQDRGPGVRAFFEDAWANGVGRQGMSIPIRGPSGEAAVFSLTGSEDDEAWRSRMRAAVPYLQIVGFEIHRGVTALAETPPANLGAGSRLSPREREVLWWAAAGKTVWETGRLLGLSEQTAQSYIRDAIRRLGAINKTHAVAEAVRLGLI